MRPDLGRAGLLAVLATAAGASVLAAVIGARGSPSSTAGQLAGVLAAGCLLLPAAFSVVKRSGLAKSPPAWFIGHVFAGAAGMVFAVGHAAGGDLLSPPVLLLVGVMILVVQGTLARAWLSSALSARFGAGAMGFATPDPARRTRIIAVIEAKRRVLGELDPEASEAEFSPALAHWLRRPVLSCRYQSLALTEATLVGARARAGALLSRWRALHLLLAWTVLAGVLVHVVLALFFAGYVAEGRPIDWWHISDWGG